MQICNFILSFCLAVASNLCQADIQSEIIVKKSGFDKEQYFFVVKNGNVVLSQSPLLDGEGQPVIRSLIFGFQGEHSFLNASRGMGFPLGQNFVFPVYDFSKDFRAIKNNLFSSSGRFLGQVLSPTRDQDRPMIMTFPHKRNSKYLELGIADRVSNNDVIPLNKYNGDAFKLRLGSDKKVTLAPLRLENSWFVFEIAKKIYLATSKGFVHSKVWASPLVRSLDSIVATNPNGSQSLIVKSHNSPETYLATTIESGFKLVPIASKRKLKSSKTLFFSFVQYGYYVAVMTDENKKTSFVTTMNTAGEVLDIFSGHLYVNRVRFFSNILFLNENNPCLNLLIPSPGRPRNLLLDPTGKMHKLKN